MGDPFDTAGLRAGVIAAWQGSPTRLREDAATEADLVRAGYRDRVLTELAQNAADAAAKAGVAGRLAVWLDGRVLHIANTGVALDISGVHALTALRASAKTAGPAASEAAVGQFGVGFTAVLSVAEEVEFRSTSGSVRFSRAETAALLAAEGVKIPEVEGEFVPPALRLAWPSAAKPAAGFDSEIVLELRPDVDGDALLAGMRAEAVDLLLELPALQSISIADDEIRCAVTDLDNGLQEVRVTGEWEDRRWWQYRTPHARWLLPLREGRPVAVRPDVLRAPTRSDEELSLPALLIADIPMQPDRRRLLPGAQVAELASGYADFALALPPADRLVLVPAPGFARSEPDTVLREALIAELREHSWLPVLRGPVFGSGGEALGDPRLIGSDHALGGNPELGADPLLEFDAALEARASSAAGPGADTAASAGEDSLAGARGDSAAGSEGGAGDDSFAASAEVRGPDEDATFQLELTFGDSGTNGVLRQDLSAQTGVPSESGTRPGDAAWPEVGSLPRTTSTADSTEELGERPRRASVFPGATPELARLLAEIVGPLVIPELSGRAGSDALAALDVHRIGLARIAELSSSLERPAQWWYSLYDALEPFVLDPLSVEELGALSVPLADGRLVTGPRTVVLDLQLENAIPVHWARLVHPEAAHELLGRLGARAATPEDLLNDPALQAILEDDPSEPDTVEAVLNLAGTAMPGTLPTWLGLLELPDDSGELLPADELLLPAAPLDGVLVADSPFEIIAEETLEKYGRDALRAIGVGWSFTLAVEEDPTGPDHHLDDEDAWWEGLREDPPELRAVRDLDLVDDAKWPEALRLLLSDESTRPLLSDRDGYTAWWLRKNAHIDDIPLGLMRHPEDESLAGLLPQLLGFSDQDLLVLRGVLAAPEIMTAQLAEELLDALADPTRSPTPEAISQTHRRLGVAMADGLLDVEDLDFPDHVRALSGAVIDPADALILDKPWFGPALPADRLIVGDIASAPSLSALLDIPLASEVVTAEVLGEGRRTTWNTDPLGVLLRLQFGSAYATGDLVVHDDLRVRLTGAVQATVAVPWWQDGDTVHVRAQPHG
ncbi:sacsin N-terminal ATP-binding-like domain-containing protein [Nocardia sp. NPDC058058]|uniref:sacsin N-terminal ATP-binding-like domain-containing protein n=1 Tax=Nocardia sp. NPDC058058 TaxID=3346317 RepID=UPI0036DCEC6D